MSTSQAFTDSFIVFKTEPSEGGFHPQPTLDTSTFQHPHPFPPESNDTPDPSPSSPSPFVRTIESEETKRPFARSGPSSSTSRSKEKLEKREGGKDSHHRHMWSVDETDALIAGCQKHGVGNWKAILNDIDLRPRFSADRNPGDLKDRFRTKFPQAYSELYPNAKTHIPTRTLSEGSKSHFEKGQSKERRCFSAAEDMVLKQGFATHGSSWTTIAKDPIFGGRRKPTDLRDRFRNAWPQEYAMAGYSSRKKNGTSGSSTSKGSSKVKERTLSHGSSRQAHSHHDHAVPLPSTDAQREQNADLEGMFVRGPDGKPALARSASSASASASSSNTTFAYSESEAGSDVEGRMARGGVDFAWLRESAGYAIPTPSQLYIGNQLRTASPSGLPPDSSRSLSFGSGMAAAQGGAPLNNRPMFGTMFSSPGGSLNLTQATSPTAVNVGGLGEQDPRTQPSQWHQDQNGTSSSAQPRALQSNGSVSVDMVGDLSQPFSPVAVTYPPARSLPFAGQSQSLPASHAAPAYLDPNEMELSSLGDVQLQQINQLLQCYVQNAAKGEEEPAWRSSQSSDYTSESDAGPSDLWAAEDGMGYQTSDSGQRGPSGYPNPPLAVNGGEYWDTIPSAVNGFPPEPGYSIDQNGDAGEPFVRGDTPLHRLPSGSSNNTVPSSFLDTNGWQSQPGQERAGQSAHPDVSYSNGRHHSPVGDSDQHHSLHHTLSIPDLDALDVSSNWHEEGYEEDEEDDGEEEDDEDDDDGFDDDDQEEEEEEEEADSDDLLPRSSTIRPPKRLSSEEDEYGRRAALLYQQHSGNASDSSLSSTLDASVYAPPSYMLSDGDQVEHLGRETGDLIVNGAGTQGDGQHHGSLSHSQQHHQQHHHHQQQQHHQEDPYPSDHIDLDLAALLRADPAGVGIDVMNL